MTTMLEQSWELLLAPRFGETGQLGLGSGADSSALLDAGAAPWNDNQPRAAGEDAEEWDDDDDDYEDDDEEEDEDDSFGPDDEEDFDDDDEEEDDEDDDADV